jgi:hypothetical protein
MACYDVLKPGHETHSCTTCVNVKELGHMLRHRFCDECMFARLESRGGKCHWKEDSHGVL